jgi:hypothetical protein
MKLNKILQELADRETEYGFNLQDVHEVITEIFGYFEPKVKALEDTIKLMESQLR